MRVCVYVYIAIETRIHFYRGRKSDWGMRIYAIRSIPASLFTGSLSSGKNQRQHGKSQHPQFKENLLIPVFSVYILPLCPSSLKYLVTTVLKNGLHSSSASSSKQASCIFTNLENVLRQLIPLSKRACYKNSSNSFLSTRLGTTSLFMNIYTTFIWKRRNNS